MSLNKVILIGNVGKDPEVRYFDAHSAIASFSVATSERGYTLANGTEVPERTEWHNVVARREQVSFVEKWVRKGACVYVEGKIRTRTYDDSSGFKRYLTEIVADRIEFFSSGGRREESPAASTSAPQPPAASPTPASAPSTTSNPPLPGEQNHPNDTTPF
jgi:single-strand DNA-binding protein